MGSQGGAGPFPVKRKPGSSDPETPLWAAADRWYRREAGRRSVRASLPFQLAQVDKSASLSTRRSLPFTQVQPATTEISKRPSPGIPSPPSSNSVLPAERAAAGNRAALQGHFSSSGAETLQQG